MSVEAARPVPITEDQERGLVHHLSPPESKIALFRSLFRGRDNVYPRRFDTRANASGWYGRDPQVSNHTDGKSPVLGPCRTVALSRISKPFWHMLLWPDSRAARSESRGLIVNYY